MDPRPAARTSRRRGPALWAALLCAGSGLGACETIPRTTIDGADESVLFPTGRISWDLSAPDDAATPDAAREQPRTSTRLELDLGYGSGSFTQEVRDGQILQVGGVPFAGPDSIEVITDLWTADVAGRMEQRWPSGLGLGGRVGLRLSDLDITLRSGSLTFNTENSADLTSLGLLAGVDAFYEPTRWLRLYVAGSLSYGLELSGVASSYQDITTTTLDLGTSWSLGRSVRLLGGWRRMDYEADSVDNYLSDLELALSGPFLGLWLCF